MSLESCDQNTERLVEYADGELAATETVAVAGHLDVCPVCRRRLAALRRSLAAAQEVWQDAGSAAAPAARPWLYRAGLGVAAAILLIGLAWFVGPQRPGPTATAAQIEREVADAGLAEQMLLSGRMLAETPGGQSYAVERFRFITEHYPATVAAREARTRLVAITEKG
jgi:anti-sigma factor RsiW